MPKKTYTAEERKAIGERLAAGKAAKNSTVVEEKSVTPQEPQPAPAEIATEESPSVLAQQVLELKAQMELLIKMNQGNTAPGAVISGGRIIGTVEKYLVDPAHYQDPRDRLREEPKLQRFAFKTNYELIYQVQTTSYETKDGVNTKEPRFNLELHRIVFNDDGPTDKRVILRRLTFHEDPQAAIIVARENDLDPDNYPGGEDKFLDDMRYLRIRSWLLEAFYPPKNDQSRQNIREEVIGGKMFQTFEVSSRDSATIPFDQLDKKW